MRYIYGVARECIYITTSAALCTLVCAVAAREARSFISPEIIDPPRARMTRDSAPEPARARALTG